jgi:tight adherence protein C
MPAESIELFRNAAFLVISLLTVATLYMIVSPILEGDKRKKRMNSVANARENLKQMRQSELNRNPGLRSEGKGFTKRLVDRFSLEKLLETSDIKDKLAQAGMRGQSPIYTFYVFRLVMPTVLLFVGLILFVGLNVREWSLVQNIFATLCMTLFGLYLPGIYVKNAAGKRQNAIIPVFPDALDLLLICVESGMSVELAFGKVAEEMAESSIELAEEFSLTTAELSYLSSRRLAYENFARRNNHPGIKAVSTALIQAERYGTPLGDTLRTMANENRQMRVMQAEKKAASLPAKLTVPMILFFLPVLFIVILTPAAMRLGNALG